MDITCCICLCNPTYAVNCSNRCESYTCYDCITSMIDYYDLSIKCSECNNFYYYEDLNVCDNTGNILVNNLNVYVQKLIKTLEQKGEEDFNKYVMNKNIIERTRESRKIYIKSNYPKAIQKILEICYSKDLAKVNINNIQIPQKTNKKCSKQLCQGFLIQKDNIYQCDFCDEKICTQCESVCTLTHTCNQEDIDSLIVINKYIRCPKCNTPVTKIDGCDNMTCGVCSATFNYANGEISIAGSHNPTPVKLKDDSIFKLLTKSVYDDDVTEAITHLDNHKPKIHDMNSVYEILVNGNWQRFVKKFDRYLLILYRYKNYTQKVNLLIDLDKIEKLKSKYIRKIISICYETNN